MEHIYHVKRREGDTLGGQEFSGGTVRVVPHELSGPRKKAIGCQKPPEGGIKFKAYWVF